MEWEQSEQVIGVIFDLFNTLVRAGRMKFLRSFRNFKNYWLFSFEFLNEIEDKFDWKWLAKPHYNNSLANSKQIKIQLILSILTLKSSDSKYFEKKSEITLKMKVKTTTFNFNFQLLHLNNWKLFWITFSYSNANAT